VSQPEFDWFETVILDTSIDTDKKQIKMLELAIQHGEEKKVDYNPIDRLVGVYQDIIETELLTIEEYAQSTNENYCAKGGAWGIVEVFVDTIVLCTMTAFVILTVPSNSTDATTAVIFSYSYFGEWGGYFIGVSLGVFALASVVCWSYYGTSGVKYLTNKKIACGLYLICYSAAGIVGSVFVPSLVWEISDISVSLMAIFNISCVILLSKFVKEETELYFN
jgi:AGCS family alanine or glycine:cation symporter